MVTLISLSKLATPINSSNFVVMDGGVIPRVPSIALYYISLLSGWESSQEQRKANLVNNHCTLIAKSFLLSAFGAMIRCQLFLPREMENLWWHRTSSRSLACSSRKLNYRSKVEYLHYRLNEDQFQPVLDRMLAADRETTEALLKSKGEERMRFGTFC